MRALAAARATALRYDAAVGGIVTFRPKGGVARAHAIAAATAVFTLAVSVSGVESLICSPAAMTHASLTPEERVAIGISDDLLRLSVGIEDVDDLLADLRDALNAADVVAPQRTATSA